MTIRDNDVVTPVRSIDQELDGLAAEMGIEREYIGGIIQIQKEGRRSELSVKGIRKNIAKAINMARYGNTIFHHTEGILFNVKEMDSTIPGLSRELKPVEIAGILGLDLDYGELYMVRYQGRDKFLTPDTLVYVDVEKGPQLIEIYNSLRGWENSNTILPRAPAQFMDRDINLGQYSISQMVLVEEGDMREEYFSVSLGKYGCTICMPNDTRFRSGLVRGLRSFRKKAYLS